MSSNSPSALTLFKDSASVYNALCAYSGTGELPKNRQEIGKFILEVLDGIGTLSIVDFSKLTQLAGRAADAFADPVQNKKIYDFCISLLLEEGQNANDYKLLPIPGSPSSNYNANLIRNRYYFALVLLDFLPISERKKPEMIKSCINLTTIPSMQSVLLNAKMRSLSEKIRILIIKYAQNATPENIMGIMDIFKAMKLIPDLEDCDDTKEKIIDLLQGLTKDEVLAFLHGLCFLDPSDRTGAVNQMKSTLDKTNICLSKLLSFHYSNDPEIAKRSANHLATMLHSNERTKATEVAVLVKENEEVFNFTEGQQLIERAKVFLENDVNVLGNSSRNASPVANYGPNHDLVASPVMLTNSLMKRSHSQLF